MLEQEGHPLPCERDGSNVKEISERPTITPGRQHTEWHDSRTGRNTEPPDKKKVS